LTGDPVLVTVGVRDGDQLHAVDLTDHPGVVPAHRPQPDQPHPDRLSLGDDRLGGPAAQLAGHQAPAPTTVLTAAAIRSRSSWLSDGCTGRLITSAAARAVSGSSWAGANRASDTSSWFGMG